MMLYRYEADLRPSARPAPCPASPGRFTAVSPLEEALCIPCVVRLSSDCLRDRRSHSPTLLAPREAVSACSVVCLSICLSLYVCLFVRAPMGQSVSTLPFACLSVGLCLSVLLFVILSLWSGTVSSLAVSVWRFVCLPVCLSICLSVCVSVSLWGRLSLRRRVLSFIQLFLCLWAFRLY